MRSRLIDTLKGIGALLVVIGHLVPSDSIVKVYIYSFHMPLFFILAGYVFNSNSKNFIYKKFKSLILPYFVFVIISMFINYDITQSMSIAEILKNIFYLNGNIIWNSSLWFLPVLFFTSVCYKLITRTKKHQKNILLIFVLLIGYKFSNLNIILPFGFHILPISLIFYHVGYICKTNNIFDYFLKKKNIYFVFIIFISIYVSWLFGRTNMSTNSYNYYFIYFIIAIIAIIPYIKIGSILKDKRMINLYGKYSLIMFGTQRMLFKLYNIFSKRLSILNNYYFTILITILIYSIIIILYEKIKSKKSYHKK